MSLVPLSSETSTFSAPWPAKSPVMVSMSSGAPSRKLIVPLLVKASELSTEIGALPATSGAAPPVPMSMALSPSMESMPLLAKLLPAALLPPRLIAASCSTMVPALTIASSPSPKSVAWPRTVHVPPAAFVRRSSPAPVTSAPTMSPLLVTRSKPSPPWIAMLPSSVACATMWPMLFTVAVPRTSRSSATAVSALIAPIRPSFTTLASPPPPIRRPMVSPAPCAEIEPPLAKAMLPLSE
jgi:hypothetical protein